MHFLKGHGNGLRIHAVAFSPSGTELASCGADGKVRLWDLASGEQTKEIMPRRTPVALCYSPDGRSLAWPDEDLVQVQRDGDPVPLRIGQTASVAIQDG